MKKLMFDEIEGVFGGGCRCQRGSSGWDRRGTNPGECRSWCCNEMDGDWYTWCSGTNTFTSIESDRRQC